MDQLWPSAGPAAADLHALYDYPPSLAQPHVRVNFVSSLDGAVAVHGRSGALSDPADREVFALQRAMADVIVVGAGTVRAEGYRGARTPARYEGLRADRGLAPAPAIAVVTASCWLTPEHGLVADTVVPPVVLTVSSAPEARRRALSDAGAVVLVAGDERVELRTALRLLGGLGLRRVLCEGGPEVLGGLVADDLVDELCLTMSPRLVAGSAGRIAGTPFEPDAVRLRLASAVHADDVLLLRYLRTAVAGPSA